MFESIDWRDHSVRTLRLPVPELCIDGELPALIRAVQHGEAMLFADKHAAIAEMHYRQVAPVQDSDRFGLDAWAVLQAEVGALLEVSAALAHNAISDALALRDRIPAVADLLHDGTLTVRQAKIVIDRTNLIDDDSESAVQLNAALAASLSRPGSWSDSRLRNAVDRLVGLVDPDAVKRRRERAHGERGVRFSALEDGMGEILARVTAEDAAAIKERVEQFVREVCAKDPRTKAQRRADAFVAALLGKPALACTCATEDCKARSKDILAQAQSFESEVIDFSRRQVAVHVVINESTLAGADDQPALIEGVGVIDADHARKLAADSDAVIRPISVPGFSLTGLSDALTYRPGRALDNYVRIRDGYCVWPGCSQPARFADIDHTVEFDHQDPSAGGPTSHTNCKALCRFHHLVKTFTEWRDRQRGSTGFTFTALDGSDYAGPASSTVELFPDLEPPPSRRRARAKDRSYRKRYERNKNHIDIDAAQSRRNAELYDRIVDERPPPF
ncbi:HNH endonuclease signature motif containing protein [Jongsikchunia kroppenstedtii]|uniref:HNH endonuclease signature motif containing protein n=1 Tax=Jongsikchunia kroppenstedtii TaxID=1121721 RepID=UPI00035C7B69|nr:HNH endonuclease signature motif containing protein [Jongsikchunia kroppenstedtii]